MCEPVGMRDHRKLASIFFGMAAAMGLVGAFLPWAIVSVPQAGGPPRIIERTALHGDGALTAACSGAALALAIFTFFKPGRKAQLAGMILLGAVVTFIGFTVYARFPPTYSVGIGLYLTLIGAIDMICSSVFFTWALGRAPAEVTEGPLPIIKE